MKPETPISHLSLDAKPHRALFALGINTVGEFLSADLQRVLEVPGMGHRTLVRLTHIRQQLGGSDKEGCVSNVQTSNPDWQSVLGGLSTRMQNGLQDLGIDSFDKFLAIREEDFLSRRGIGRTCWAEVAAQQKLFGSWTPVSAAKPDPLQRIREMLGGRALRVLDTFNVQTLDDLFSLSRKQVISSTKIGPTTWREIQDAIKRVAAPAEAVHPPSINDLSLDDLPLFGRTIMEEEIMDLPDRFFPHVLTEGLSLSFRCQSILSALDIHTLGELLCTPAEKLLRQPNFGEISLNALHESVRKYMEFRNNSHVEPAHAKSLADMVAQLCCMVGESSEKQKILVNKLGVYDCSPETPDAIGQRFGLSKERGRQILKEICRAISQDHQTRPILDRFRESVKDSLHNAGGILWLDELSEQLSQRLHWQSAPTPANPREFFRLFGFAGISLGKQEISLDHPCRKCEIVPNRFNEFMQERSRAFPLGSKILPESLCGDSRSDTCPMVSAFSGAFLQELAGRAGLVLDDAAIYTQDMWDLEYGGLSRKVEIILKRIGRVAQPREVWEALYPYLEDFGSPKKVHSALIGAKNVYIWGRGEFIHLDHIHIQEEGLTSLRTILASRLQETPFVALVGIFREYRVTWQNAGIPNEYALASIVRLHLANDFHCDRYRYVYRESQSKATSIDREIEEWVLEQEGPVNRRDLKDWLVDRIGVRPSLITLALGRLPSIVPADKGKLIHIDNTGLDAERLYPLKEYIIHALKTYDHISVGKLYNEKRVTCLALQITSQRMLYGVMRYFFSNEFDFPRLPHICRPDHSQEPLAKPRR